MQFTKFRDARYCIKNLYFRKVPHFPFPTSIIGIDGKEVVFPKIPEGRFPYLYECSGGLTFEPDVVRKCIRAGKTESEILSLNDSLIVARVEDEIRRQLGVKYEADDL